MAKKIQVTIAALCIALSVGQANAQTYTTDQILDAIDNMQSMFETADEFSGVFGGCDASNPEQCAYVDLAKKNMVQSMDARMRKMIALCAMVPAAEVKDCDRRVTWKVEDFTDSLAEKLNAAPPSGKWQRDIRRLFY